MLDTVHNLVSKIYSGLSEVRWVETYPEYIEYGWWMTFNFRLYTIPLPIRLVIYFGGCA